nr:hypothetical protein [uncultured Anaerocolumna sp.]
MNNENQNESNLNENQFSEVELDNAPKGVPEETPFTETASFTEETSGTEAASDTELTSNIEAENNTAGENLNTQSEDLELNKENITEEMKEDISLQPSDSQPNVETLPEAPVKKKQTGKIVAALLILVVVLAGSITAFANRNKLSNTIAMMTKSSSQYYAYIEQKNLDKQINSVTKNYSKSQDNYKKGIGAENNLSFTISPALAMMMGLNEIKPINAKLESISKDGLSSFNGVLSYDNKTLASLELLSDMNTSDYYLKVPELSSAYLLMTMKDMIDSGIMADTDFDYNEYAKNLPALLGNQLLSENALNEMLKRYSSDIYNNIKTVEVKKNVDVTASTITSSYSKLTATVTDTDLYNIALAILEDAKTDKDLAKITASLQLMTEDEYYNTIETTINDLKADKSTLTNEPMLNMVLYTDSNGNITGREITILDGSSTSLGYTTARDGSKLGFQAWFKEKDLDILDVTANGTIGNGFTGDSVISFNYYDEYYDETTSTSFNVALENVKLKDNKLDGKFTLTSDEMLGTEFVVEFKSANKQQDINIKMMAGGIETIALLLTTKEIPVKDIKMPSSSEKIVDMMNNMDSYIEAADLEGFMTNIQTILAEDFGPLFDLLLYGM